MLQLTTKKTKWFKVEQDATGETQIEILHLKPGEVQEIEAKANQVTSKQYENSEDFVTEIDYNLHARTKKYVTTCIVSWKGFKDASGKELKCTDHNKLLVLQEFEWFAEFITNCRNELAEEAAAAQEGAEKN